MWESILPKIPRLLEAEGKKPKIQKLLALHKEENEAFSGSK